MVSKIIIALPFYPPLQGRNLGIRINDMLLDEQKKTVMQERLKKILMDWKEVRDMGIPES
jgi:hypothetical protein